MLAHCLSFCSRSPDSSTRTSPKLAIAAFIPCPVNSSTSAATKCTSTAPGQGAPTVILDSGLGDSYISWHKVQPQIAQVHACLFLRSRRPRLQRFQPAPAHQQSHCRGVAHPFAQCGNLSALRSRRATPWADSMFAFTPAFIAAKWLGMVLVDSSHPEQQKRFPPALNDHGRDVGAGAGISDILHAIRNSASAGILRQRCRGSRRRMQLSQLSRRPYGPENVL